LVVVGLWVGDSMREGEEGVGCGCRCTNLGDATVYLNCM
jgi:hypothetical protein